MGYRPYDVTPCPSSGGVRFLLLVAGRSRWCHGQKKSDPPSSRIRPHRQHRTMAAADTNTAASATPDDPSGSAATAHSAAAPAAAAENIVTSISTDPALTAASDPPSPLLLKEKGLHPPLIHPMMCVRQRLTTLPTTVL
jgi:hypothetical protein